jgi:AAA domain (dynein-related subfamily)
MIKNVTAFDKSLNDFADFAQSGKLQKQERYYKEELISILGPVLSDDSLRSPDFSRRLAEAVKKCAKWFTNLTYYMATDDFQKYLSQIESGHIADLLRGLFDESKPIASRFDSFQDAVNQDYAKLFGPKKKIAWIPAILLTARFPDRYTFYRPSVVNEISQRWGIDLPKDGSYGEKYIAYLDALKPIQAKLSEVLGREADLIDTHSFLWVNRDGDESWRKLLQEWLKENSKTIPDELRKLRDEFVRRFPKDKLASMSLEDYAEGLASKDSFGNWVEFKTKDLGDMRGSTVHKWGVWWDRKAKEWRWTSVYRNEHEALERMTNGLQEMVSTVDGGNLDGPALDELGERVLGSSNSLRCKPLSLYFPKHFLPIFQPQHLMHFIESLEKDGNQETSSEIERLDSTSSESESSPVIVRGKTGELIAYIGREKHGLSKLKELVREFESGEYKTKWSPGRVTWFINHRDAILAAAGSSATSGVLTLNRQLLTFLRAQPEFEGFDTFGMAKFLYDSLPPPKQNLVDHTGIWKIAPGEDAKFWEMCKECGCIVVHWISDVDFRTYPDQKAIKEALIKAGQKKGGVKQIWEFTHDIGIGEIVVANKATDTVVGLGKITSDYLPPDNPENPSKDPEYRHTRKVRWIIDKPITLSAKFFGQRPKTVDEIDLDQWQAIKAAYLKQYPQLESAFRDLERKEESPMIGNVEPLISELLNICTRTGNLILYGPPGTGKTYWVRRFAEHFIRPQLIALAFTEEAGTRTLQSLKWYEAVALTMALSEKESFKVTELQNDPTLKRFASLRQTKKLNNMIWAQLQMHTDPESKTVKYSGKHFPYLFDKNPDSEWSLTPTGRAYVEENLSEEIAQLKNPAIDKPEASDFYEFVTFHQSFAYEEFVEGLKPVTSDNEEGEISYEVRRGRFRQICERAEVAWNAHREKAPKYLLVIDEINRANIAKVFGELITLLEDDKRLGKPNELKVRLPYSGDSFGVPPNLYVIGTMNTADRSIALLDLALRRRFSFVELMPDPSLLKSVDGIDLAAVLTKINQRIVLLLDRDHQIGHSYLFDVKNVQELHFAWFHPIMPLLQEYFYNDNARLHAILGDDFLEKSQTSRDFTSTELEELVDVESDRYSIKAMDVDTLKQALLGFLGKATAE